jgi:diguanylate cyclase (GGDEF)-like protein/PAS domain S-box-containing protein
MAEAVQRVLLVEDSGSDALLVKHALRRRFAVDHACSPAEAQEMMRARRYAAVITDYNLPGMTGISFQRWIAAQEYDVPVIVMSGHGDEQVAADALKLGAYDYVIKSDETMGALALTVEHALRRRELERRAHLLQQIVEHASDAILTVQADGQVLTANRAAGALLGYAPEEVPGRPLAEFFPEAREAFDAAALLAGGEEEGWQGELSARRKDATRFPVHMTLSVLRESAARGRCLIAIARDETERRQLLDRLQRLSLTDNLTGLYNHRHFHDRLREEYLRARRDGTPLSCVIADLDLFKTVNDTYGHLVGDEVLKAVAGLIAGAARTEDIVARYGGEEFAVLMPGLDLSEAIRCAEHAWDSIGTARIATTQGPLHLTASLGVATLTKSVRDEAELCRRADEALLAAKRRGRNNVCVWNPRDFDDSGAEAVITGTRLAEVRTSLRQLVAPAKMKYIESMRPLVETLCRRSPGLKRHVENVTIYAVELARAAGMTTEEVETVRNAAFLHDVGRLLAEGAVEPEKVDGPKGESRSAWAGMELLTEMRALVEEVRYVRHHMTPYTPTPEEAPRAPAGEQIVLGARVLAVADAYDTLRSGGDGRAPLEPGAAAEALRAMAGTRLDPKLVELFLAGRMREGMKC